MVKSTGFIGLGSTLKMGDNASPEVFTAIANVANIDGPKPMTEFVEATHLGSTAREWRPHLQDGGEVSFPVHIDPSHATHDETTGIWKVWKDKLLRNFRISLGASGERLSFPAHIQDINISVQTDDLIKATITLKLDDTPTLEADA